jgi:hypothetical protein
MLEHPSLWLSAAIATWPPGLPRTGRWLRWVLAGDTRAPLGHIAGNPGRWWPWPAGARFAAYELPDVSLLFTARQTGWVRRRTVVVDADAFMVSVIRGPYVLCRGNRFAAYHRPGSRVFLGPEGIEIARWRPDGVGTLIEFGDGVRDDPFAKMGILAAVLTAG